MDGMCQSKTEREREREKEIETRREGKKGEKEGEACFFIYLHRVERMRRQHRTAQEVGDLAQEEDARVHFISHPRGDLWF